MTSDKRKRWKKDNYLRGTVNKMKEHIKELLNREGVVEKRDRTKWKNGLNVSNM